MTNLIDKETYQQAGQQLLDIDSLKRSIDFLSPDLISTKFSADSNFPVASVCFRDAGRALSESRYALLESFAHKIWFLEKSNPPDEVTGVFFARYYADDTALRLYSAAEHLARAVVFVMNINDESIKNKRAGSRFGTVWKILSESEPSHPISQSIDKLYSADDWKRTINYRNSWVHNQPPIIEGLGTMFERKRRWQKTSKNTSFLGIGSGDAPQYSIKDLHSILQSALACLVETLGTAVDFYVCELEKKGITIGESGIQVSLFRHKTA